MNKPTRRPADDVPWQKPADLSPEEAASLFNQMEVPASVPPLPRRAVATPAPVTVRKFATHYEGMSLALGVFFGAVFLACLSYFLLANARDRDSSTLFAGATIFFYLLAIIAPIIIVVKICLTLARSADLLEEIAEQNRK